MSATDRQVGCDLRFQVGERVTLALQVAVAGGPPVAGERLDISLDGEPLAAPVAVVPAAHGGRIHVVHAGAGELSISYAATVGDAIVPDLAAGGHESTLDEDSLVALRQSRYCPSDALAGWVATGLAHIDDGPGLARDIAAWVHDTLTYELGVSRPTDTAVDTLLAGAGACRDFAHLTAALCRARGVPARLVAVYAPGLDPMDFHAVVEAQGPAGWELVDATRLAPRQSLVRVATGRDAADTAFATTLHGAAELLSSEVRAVVGGDLPLDDHTCAVAVA